MALYELRTYQVYVGKMRDAFAAYQDYGWPAIRKGSFDSKLIGYFTSDTGGLHQIVHLWKFDDYNDRLQHWDKMFQDPAFMEFAGKIRPLLMSQNNQLLNASPWGPHP